MTIENQSETLLKTNPNGAQVHRADVDIMSSDENRKLAENEFSRSRTRGFVIRCDGEHAIVAADVVQGSDSKQNYWSVGQLIAIKVGKNRIIGIACSVETPRKTWIHGAQNEVHITMELVGEIVDSGEEGKPDKFSSGIASYPQMGCVAHKIRSEDLAIIYKSDGDTVVKVGQLTQDQSIDAKIEIDKLLSRHFAVVGTTGVGKSTSVTLIMRKIIKVRPDIRVLMLDPHNEFASAFPDTSVVVDSSNLILPFWLFKLEEFSEVVFRGQEGFDAELELLRDIIPMAKERYRDDMDKSSTSLVKKKSKNNLTADMPVPYRMTDLFKIIDERLGKLDGKAEKPILKSLEYRLKSISEDPRFRFMFDQTNGNGGDIMEQIVSKIFRVPQNGKPICVLEMSGLPTEVVNSVVSILSRMAFELAMNSDGAIQTLVVCEEAHRYIPADKSAGFWPTRQAIARIAKEGRKYGVFLSIITQRPGELDPTILSQCNTIFAMRLGNQRDQEIIRGAVTNGAKSTISFLSSIANRECIAFGEAISTPMRMTFETMRAEDLPGAHIYEQQEKVKQGMTVSLSSVLRRMRHEDVKPMSDDPYAGVNEELGSKVVQNLAQAATVNSQNPGNAINQVMNSQFSNPNTTLTPQQTPPLAPRSPQVSSTLSASGQSSSSTPRKTAGVGNLINSFRGK